MDKDEYQTVKNYFIQVISREVNSPISGQKVSVQEFFRELSSNNDLFGSKKPAIEQKRITESTTSSVNRKKNVQSKQKETIATHCSNPSGNNTAQPVVQYTKEGKKIKTYPSVKQAAKAVEVDPKGIRNVLQGKQKTSGGFVWRTPDDDFDSIQMKLKIE